MKQMTSQITSATPEESQALAEATAEAMWTRDRAAQAMCIRILGVKPGYAKIEMAVRADMVNGHHICHGGMIFTLADAAFAYACNSYNKNTVALACNIDFLAPAKEGETLQAEAVEQSQSGRTGVYDVTIRNSEEKAIALFRGKSYRIQGEVISGLAQGEPKPLETALHDPSIAQ